MPARVGPTSGLSGGRAETDAAMGLGGKKQQLSELTLCFSLCSLFDFDKTGMVTREDWQRGMTTLMLDELGNDAKIWTRMTDMHGKRDGGKAMVDVNRLADIVPIDPRVGVLLNAIVKGLVGMREFVERSLRKETKDAELKMNRALLNIRRRIVEPVLKAWRNLVRGHRGKRARPSRARRRMSWRVCDQCADLTVDMPPHPQARDNKKLFSQSVRRARYHVHFKAWRTWREGVEICHQEKRELRKQERRKQRIHASAMRLKNRDVRALRASSELTRASLLRHLPA